MLVTLSMLLSEVSSRKGNGGGGGGGGGSGGEKCVVKEFMRTNSQQNLKMASCKHADKYENPCEMLDAKIKEVAIYNDGELSKTVKFTLLDYNWGDTVKVTLSHLDASGKETKRMPADCPALPRLRRCIHFKSGEDQTFDVAKGEKDRIDCDSSMDIVEMGRYQNPCFKCQEGVERVKVFHSPYSGLVQYDSTYYNLGTERSNLDGPWCATRVSVTANDGKSIYIGYPHHAQSCTAQ